MTLPARGSGAPRHPRPEDAASGSLDALDDVKPLYMLPRDDLANEALIPAFRCARAASCMVGFFSSAVLAELAPGLATYLNSSTEPFKLIISPYLSEADQRAIAEGVRDPATVGADVLLSQLASVDGLQQHTLRCFAFLLAAGRLEVKIALMREGLFHPKVWLFKAPQGLLAVHGSSNLTQAALRRNKEQITVSRAWADPTQRYIAEKLRDEFTELWSDRDDDCVVIGLPEAVRERVLRGFHGERPPTEDDYRALYRSVAARKAVREPPPEPVPAAELQFHIPPQLRYDTGPFAHQGAAVRAWLDAGRTGTLEMATGSGKTITAMIAAYRTHEQEGPLLLVIAAPYLPLIDQWCTEAAAFGVRPINLSAMSGASARQTSIQQAARRLRLGLTSAEVLVVSHDTLCTEAFQQAVAEVSAHRMLIADEAHNLGRDAFVRSPPGCFESRLALSATPVRQYDPEGTDQLLAYFGPVVYRFTLDQAIGVCLVEYDYFVHSVELSHDEMDAWSMLTARIKQEAWRAQRGQDDEYLTKLLRDRRAILETAAAKVEALRALLRQADVRQLRHTLIYATDKAPEQLLKINALLHERRVQFHQLTAEETQDRGRAMDIIRAFQDGDIQVLTAKRVLDEGVNIPQVRTAYILASTTVERQWVQRRGRVLRMCSAIGKTSSEIHDFVALPPGMDAGLDDDARSLVRGELHRMQEFARLARNAGKPDGPLPLIHELVRRTMM